MEAVEKLTETNAAYEKEQHRLQRDLTQSRKDIKEAQDDRRKLQEEVRHLRDALDVATSTKVWCFFFSTKILRSWLGGRV